MKDKKCPICKQENSNLIIIDDHTVNNDIFSQDVFETLERDKDDLSVWY